MIGIELIDSVLEGPTAVMLGYDDQVSPVKALSDFAKANEILINSQTLEGIKDHIVVKENPPHQFKGISHEVVTFSVIGKKDLSAP